MYGNHKWHGTEGILWSKQRKKGVPTHREAAAKVAPRQPVLLKMGHGAFEGKSACFAA